MLLVLSVNISIRLITYSVHYPGSFVRIGNSRLLFALETGLSFMLTFLVYWTVFESNPS